MGWEGYLTLDGVEIINAARTEAYAATAGAPWFKPVYNNDALRVLLGQSPYSTPGIDLAPWYDEDTVDSYNFWGFYPLSVDGLDDSSRTGNPVEFTTDGGSPGRVRSTMKSVVYSGLLVGETETAVEYGMRWLRRALLGAKCATVRADTTTLGSTVGFLSAAPVFPLYLPGSSPVDGDTVFLSGGDATGIPAPYAAIGACGLCTVTTTVCTRSSASATSAMRCASVSIRSTGSPATTAATRSASSP